MDDAHSVVPWLQASVWQASRVINQDYNQIGGSIMEKQTGTFGSFALGFLFGGLVGAAVALLTAPQSGEETREQIQHETERLREQMAKAVDEMRSSIEESSEDFKKRAEEILEAARAKVDEVKARLESLQAQGKTALEEGKERAAEVVEEAAASVGVSG